jgi:hypothetical protein
MAMQERVARDDRPLQLVHSSSSGVAAETLASVGLEQSAGGGGKQILLDDPTANPVQRFGPG